MEANLSQQDQLVRLFLGVFLVVLWFFDGLQGIAGVTMSLIGLYMLVTGALSYDPFYKLLKL